MEIKYELICSVIIFEFFYGVSVIEYILFVHDFNLINANYSKICNFETYIRLTDHF